MKHIKYTQIHLYMKILFDSITSNGI